MKIYISKHAEIRLIQRQIPDPNTVELKPLSPKKIKEINKFCTKKHPINSDQIKEFYRFSNNVYILVRRSKSSATYILITCFKLGSYKLKQNHYRRKANNPRGNKKLNHLRKNKKPL